MTPPTLDDVYAARERLRGLLTPTALLRHPLLVEALGLDVYVKHENHNPTGAFKVRGGLNLVASLTPAERAAGIATASTGNHGQSIALACRHVGVPCTVVVPAGNNPEKNAAMRAYGAQVVESGRDFDQAREAVERLCRERGLRYVHSANEPLLIAGVATYALEIFERLPEPFAIFVPIGGGSGAAGVVTVRDGLRRATQVVGVQAQGADAFARSWRGPARVIGERVETFAEGLATRVTFDLTFEILRTGLHDVVTLSEAELREGVRLALASTHNLAEGAGGASLMAARRWRDRLAGRQVVCVMSGGNLDARMLRLIVGEPAESEC